MLFSIISILRFPFWVAALISPNLPFKGLPELYNEIYGHKPDYDPFYLNKIPKNYISHVKLIFRLFSIVISVAIWMLADFIKGHFFPPPTPVSLPLEQPPCMNENHYKMAVDLGAQGLRNFIKECKEDGGDLLHQAYADLDNILFNNGITCLKSIPICQEGVGQCIGDYQKNGVDPNVSDNKYGEYGHIDEVNRRLNKVTADCLTYAGLNTTGKRPKIELDNNEDSDDSSQSFAGMTIQYELTEGSNDCVGRKCSKNGAASTRTMVYIDPNGHDVTYFGRVDMGDKENDDGDKAVIGQPYKVGANNNWSFERVFQSDKVTKVFIIKNKVSKIAGKGGEETVHMTFITRSGMGCFVKHTIFTRSNDEKTERTYEPIPESQSCKLYPGLHKKWGT